MGIVQGLIGSLKAGVAYDSDAQAYFTAASITDGTQKDAWNTFVVSAKANGYYSKLLAAYPFLGGTASSHSYNAINPATFQITWSGSLSHNSNGVNQSVNGTGDTGFGNTSGWTSTSASFGCYLRTGITTDKIPIGDGNSTYIYGNSGTSVNFTLQAATLNATITSTRLLVVTDTGTLATAYRDGTSVGSSSTSHTPSIFNNLNLMSYGLSPFYYYAGTMSFAFIGLTMTGTDVTNFNTNMNTLQTALSRNV